MLDVCPNELLSETSQTNADQLFGFLILKRFDISPGNLAINSSATVFDE